MTRYTLNDLEDPSEVHEPLARYELIAYLNAKSKIAAMLGWADCAVSFVRDTLAELDNTGTVRYGPWMIESDVLRIVNVFEAPDGSRQNGKRKGDFDTIVGRFDHRGGHYSANEAIPQGYVVLGDE